ncbi:MAG: hypothetical protein EBS98_09520 [Chitinophagia bacterium]|jgi:hypothetical protein|nr:hypothetical protein [Chitinophagia bacterium]
MPDLLSTLNSIPQTVSDKLNSVASQATGAVAGALGSISSGISAFGTSLTAAAGSLTKSLQSAGNLSPASLSGAAQQVCGALQPQSIYKGLRPYIPQGVGEQPTDKRDSGSGAGPLKFPEDIGSHYIQLDFSKFKQDSPVTKEIKSDPVTIILPMSPNLVESYAANYKSESLGILGEAAKSIASDYFKKNPSLANPAEAEKAGAGLVEAARAYLDKEGKNVVKGMVGQLAMNALGPIGSAVSNELGASVNPHMAVIFDGIDFRTHSFSFKLYPRSEKESDALKKIISTLRRRMLPSVVHSHFFGYPDKVKITISPKSPYPFLECVLQSMSVNYSPNGPAFFKGDKGNPVGVDLTLNFKEIVIFTRDVAEKYER